MNPIYTSRLKLTLVLSLFIGPLVIAWVWYFNAEQWQPSLGANHGELLDPIISLQDISAKDAAGGAFGLAQLERRWSLLIPLHGDCEANCIETLHNTRQIRLSLGKDISRLQRVLIVSDFTALTAELLEQHPDLLVITASGLLEQIKTTMDKDMRIGGGYYLTDPLANLVLYFDNQLKPKLVLEDLKRLLKASRIG